MTISFDHQNNYGIRLPASIEKRLRILQQILTWVMLGSITSLYIHSFFKFQKITGANYRFALLFLGITLLSDVILPFFPQKGARDFLNGFLLYELISQFIVLK